MKKAIIFDFDGVIGDTYDMNFQISKEMYPHITKQNFDDLFLGNVYYNKERIFLTEKDTSLFFEKQKQLFTEKNFFEIMPILEKLNQQYKLFIISSTFDDNIKHFLKIGKIDNYFQKILGAITHRSKIEKFKMLFNEFNIVSNECVFITDTVGDILESKEVDVDTVAIAWGYHSKEILINYNPKAIADSPAQLLDIITSLSKI